MCWSKNGKRKYKYALFKCECGSKKKLKVRSVVSKNTTSCGCKQLKRLTKHNCSRTSLYHVWSCMKQRCDNPKSKNYHRYGGRGIRYKKTWAKFSNFKKWAEVSGYKQGLSIDRINNNKGYYPSNCRWTNTKIQSRNKSTNIVYKGEVARDASFRLRGHEHLVTDRIRHGWSKKDAFTKPINKKYVQ